MDPHHPGHGIGIGNPDRVIAQRTPRGDQIDRVGRAAQERKAAD